ncbi:MAG: hypothetical protein M3N22_05710, partial [Acidobacteriota bacterium]|nr:hypothetical protein [Acidobacteriota bacterium]
ATGSAVYIGGGDSDVIVTANHIIGGAFSAVKVANVFSDGPSTGIIVTLNTLTNNAYGVNVGLNAISATDTVQVHRNGISGNSLFGANNDSSGVVNATCNYWGASDGPGPVGPGSGDKVSTGVVFSPWLHNAKLRGPCRKGDKDHNKDDE